MAEKGAKGNVTAPAGFLSCRTRCVKRDGMLLRELAERLGVELEGDPAACVSGCAPIEDAGPEDLTFVAHPRYVRALNQTRAAAVVLGRGVDAPGKNVLRAANPQATFARALELFDRRARPKPGIHPSALIDATAVVGARCHLGAYTVVGEAAVLGDDCVLHPHVTVYPGARLGPGCVLHSGVVVRENVVLGAGVTLQPGAVVGADGFGFLPNPGGLPQPVPQIGSVEIGDHVDLGANATVDRAAVGKTRIGRGAKLDNLVQVAHGCQVGEGALLAAQVGIAGSSRLGRDVMLGGQVGVSGHVSVGDRAQIAAQSGVAGDVDADSVVGGSPAFDFAVWRRCMIALRKLPELLARVRALEKRGGGRTGGASE